MSTVGENGGKKEWEALVKVYDYLYSTYPDFRKQVDEFGFSTIESNDKEELVLEMDSKDSDIIVDSDKVIRILKKAGLKKFSKVESLTFDKVLEYDYNMAKGISNILVRRGKGGTLSLNLHFYYIEGKGIPSIRGILKKRGSSDWSKEDRVEDFLGLFGSLLVNPLFKEGLYWIHMVKDSLHLSVVSNGEITESVRYGDDEKLDVVLERLLGFLSDTLGKPIKEVLLLSEDISTIRSRLNSDGELTVVFY